MKIWVVCQWRTDLNGAVVKGSKQEIELQGVFDNQEDALAACVGKYYFVWGGLELNECQPDERLEPMGWYPHLDDSPPDWWREISL